MPLARVLALALATAAAVIVAGGGEAFWLCIPAALVAAGWCRSRPATAIATVTVVAAAAPGAALGGSGPSPSPAFALIVPAVSVLALRALQERLERERDALHSRAHTDPLTGAENRRSLVARIGYEIARHARDGRSFTLVMLDVDGFKLLNDRFGHAAGDELLCDLAISLRHAVRDQDTVARIGGDEFCVLAPATDLAGAQRLLTRIREAVGGVTAGVEGLRASLGTAVFPSDGRSAAVLLDAADQRLLDAKRAGRRAREAA